MTKADFIAHCPESGLNVNVEIWTFAVLIIAGVQEPVTGGTLFELNGNIGGAEFS